MLGLLGRGATTRAKSNIRPRNIAVRYVVLDSEAYADTHHGAGAVGSYLGARLLQGQCEVRFLGDIAGQLNFALKSAKS